MESTSSVYVPFRVRPSVRGPKSLFASVRAPTSLSVSVRPSVCAGVYVSFLARPSLRLCRRLRLFPCPFSRRPTPLFVSVRPSSCPSLCMSMTVHLPKSLFRYVRPSDFIFLHVCSLISIHVPPSS